MKRPRQTGIENLAKHSVAFELAATVVLPAGSTSTAIALVTAWFLTPEAPVAVIVTCIVPAATPSGALNVAMTSWLSATIGRSSTSRNHRAFH